jgi:uncharacterized Zn finger protein
VNPETGEFIRDTPEAQLPPTWPRFALGAFYEIGNHKFRLDRIYPDSIRVRLTGRIKRGEKRERSVGNPLAIREFSIGQVAILEGVTMRVKAIGKDSLVLQADKTGDKVERARKQIEMDMLRRAMTAQAEDMAARGNATG